MTKHVDKLNKFNQQVNEESEKIDSNYNKVLLKMYNGSKTQ